MKNIGKALLLSVILVAGMYALVLITFKVTLVDMRIVNISFRALNWQRMARVLTYFLPFAFCYVVLATNLHGFIRAKNGELSTFKEILVNIVILAPLYYGLAIWVGPGEYLRTHAGAIPSWAGFLYTFFWGVPLIMTIIATMSTYFFKKTGRVYLGAFLNAWLVCWVLIGQISLYA